MLNDAIRRLEEKREGMDKVYGACADLHLAMSAETGEGSLQDIITFVTTE